MADTPAATEIKGPTVERFDADHKPVFGADGHHPKLDPAREKVTATQKKLFKKLEGVEAYHTDLAKASEGGKEPDQAALDKLHQKHAPEEAKALNAARQEVKTAEAELHMAGIKAAGLKSDEELKKIPGVEDPAKARAGLKAAEKEVKALNVGGKMFGILRSGKEAGGGFGAALSHNLGSEGWKASKGKVVLKGAGTLVGLGMVYDGLLHGKRKDEQGNRTVDRSWVTRTGETLIGAVLAGGSALGGRRL